MSKDTRKWITMAEAIARGGKSRANLQQARDRGAFEWKRDWSPNGTQWIIWIEEASFMAWRVRAEAREAKRGSKESKADRNDRGRRGLASALSS